MRSTACVVLLGLVLCVATAHGSSYGSRSKYGKKKHGRGGKSKQLGHYSSPAHYSGHNSTRPYRSTTSRDSCTRKWGNCQHTRCCAGGWTCFQANQLYAQCRQTCGKSDWTCAVLGNATAPSAAAACPLSWRPHAGCGKCWGTVNEAATCTGTQYQPAGSSCPPTHPYAGCAMCHTTQAVANSCVCTSPAPYSGCNACFASAAAAAGCSTDGCPSHAPFSGCGSCHTTEAAATSCSTSLCATGLFAGCGKCYGTQTEATECV